MSWIKIKACDAYNNKSETIIPICEDLPSNIVIDQELIIELDSLFCKEKLGRLHRGASFEGTTFEVEVIADNNHFGLDLSSDFPALKKALFHSSA